MYKLIRAERLSAQKVSVGIFIQHFNLPHLNHCTVYKLVRAERYYLGYYKALQCTTFKPLYMLNSTQRPNLIDYPFTYMLKRHQFIKLFLNLSVLTPCSLYSWARNLNFLSICRCKVSWNKWIYIVRCLLVTFHSTPWERVFAFPRTPWTLQTWPSPAGWRGCGYPRPAGVYGVMTTRHPSSSSRPISFQLKGW